MAFQDNAVWLQARGQHGAECVYEAKELLKSAGWTVTSSGDASSYSSSSDLLTSEALVDVPLAWFVIEDPDDIRSFCVQTITASDDGTPSSRHLFRVKYSRAAGFAGGSPSATQVPSATDEGVCLGAGTDGSPTGEHWWHETSAGDANDRVWGGVETVAPFRFWFRSTNATDPYAGGFGWALIGVDADEDDTDPVVLYFSVGSSAYSTIHMASYSQAGGYLWGWLDLTGTPGFQRLGIQSLTDRLDLNPDSYDSAWELAPVAYAREDAQSDPDGWKGWDTGIILQLMTAIATPHTQLLNVDGGDKNWLRFQYFAVPWGGDAISNPTDWTEQAAKLRLPYTISGGGDETAPTVTNFSPAVGSTIGRYDQISFDVIDESVSGIASVVVLASYPSGKVEVVHDGTSFREYYTSASKNTRTVIEGGYNFTILRGGGWPEKPTIEMIPVDTSGNIGVIA